MKKSCIEKNGNIEFLRFFFCLIILFFHMEKYVLGEIPLDGTLKFRLFLHGSIGVEFFFLLSGLLLARHVDNIRKKKTKESIGEETSKYVVKKYKSIFPYHIIGFIIIFILSILVNKYTFTESFMALIDSIPGVLLIQMTGFMGTVFNHIEWYLSSMLIGIAIIYPFLRKYYDTFVKYVAQLVALLILGYLYFETGKLTGVMKWMVIGYKGTIRGIAELLLGIFGYYLGTELSKLKKLPKKSKVIITLIEFLLYISIIIFSIISFTSKYEFYALFAIYVLLIISYSGITYSRNMFNNKLVYFLGRLSLPIYVTQLSSIIFVNNYLINYSNEVKMIFIFVITIMLALITMVIGDILKKRIDKIDLKKYC